MTVRTDAGGLHLGARPIDIRPDGWRVYRGRIPADVVSAYPDLHPPRDEFIPASEALSDETIASWRGVPFSLLHADDLLDATTVREHMVGTVLSAVANWDGANGPETVVDVVIHDAAAQAEVESGRLVQISPGYRSEEDWTPGEHKGRRYQVVQRKRRMNHLAGVPGARTMTAEGRPARFDEHPSATAKPAAKSAGQAAKGAPYSHTADARTDMRKKKITQPDGTIIEVLVDESDPEGADASETASDPANEQARQDAVVLSPEDVEVLKKMSPEGFMAVSTALGITAAAMPEPDGDEVVAEVEDAGSMDPAAAASPMDSAGAGGGGAADPALADLMARMAKLEAAMTGGGVAGDAMPAGGAAAMPMDGKAPPFGKKDGKPRNTVGHMSTPREPIVTVDASAALAAAESQRDVAVQAARATFDASAKFVGVVRKDGHVADTTTEAATIMLRTIGKHLPRLDGAAKALVKAQRLDELVALYQQAEDIRRDAAIQSQADGVAECLRADDSAETNVLPYRTPKARGA